LCFASPASGIDPIISAYFLVYSPALFDKRKAKVPCDHVIGKSHDLVGWISPAYFRKITLGFKMGHVL